MNMQDRIRERRKALNLTQEELAVKIGLQKSAIAKYENGRVENMKRSIILKMSEALQCSPAYLMGWDESPAAQAPLRAEEFSDHEIDVIRHYRAADEPIKGAVRKLLDMPEEEKSASLDLSVG